MESFDLTRESDRLALVERVQRGEGASSVGVGARIELQLARADALLGLNRAAEALPIYTELWPQVAEASDAWWHALLGNLRCHARLDSDPAQVLQSIRQQRFLFSEFDGGEYRHQLNELEKSLSLSASKPG